MVLYINCQVAIVSTIASQTSLTSAIFHHVGRRLEAWRREFTWASSQERVMNHAFQGPALSTQIKIMIWKHYKKMGKSPLWQKTKLFVHHFAPM